MVFRVALTQPSEVFTVTPVDEAPQDYVSLVMESCSVLGETDCQFQVSGFGDDAWTVDVRYDLSTVLEQLPDLLVGLRSGEGGVLDFFGQGVERRLDFQPTSRAVAIHCASGTAWTPNPAVEHADPDRLEEMFATLAHDFAEALEIVSPGLARTPPISSWRRGEA